MVQLACVWINIDSIGREQNVGLKRNPETFEESLGIFIINVRLYSIVKCFAGVRIGIGVNMASLFDVYQLCTPFKI